MRFKFDENLPADAADVFRDVGHGVSTVLEQGMKGCSDESLAAVCADEGRILVTLDLDFADITAYPPQEHAGIIVLRLQRQDRFNVLNVLSNLSMVLQSESVDQKLWIVDEKQIRVRA